MPSKLQLVSDEFGRAVVFQGLRIVATADEVPPFALDGLTFEEDTNLLMSAGAEVSAPRESISELVADIAAFQPVAQGSVVAQGRSPVRLLAIVHDIEKTPTWDEGSVRDAMAALLKKTDALDLRAIALPVLGGVHGDLPAARFAGLLRIALEQYPPKRLERIWVRASASDADQVLDEFR
ncbi:MAG: hypothetical protein R3174_07810 [Gammaproteobacteria bacterium]|nr:hypothetical protein [Gammaproteobacteria bacterium]